VCAQFCAYQQLRYCEHAIDSVGLVALQVCDSIERQFRFLVKIVRSTAPSANKKSGKTESSARFACSCPNTGSANNRTMAHFAILFSTPPSPHRAMNRGLVFAWHTRVTSFIQRRQFAQFHFMRTNKHLFTKLHRTIFDVSVGVL